MKITPQVAAKMLRAALEQAVERMATDPYTMKAVDDIVAAGGSTTLHSYTTTLWNWSNNLSASGECQFNAANQADFIYSHFMGLPIQALKVVTGHDRYGWMSRMDW